MTDKLTVAIFFGGKSTEHEVSAISGLQVLDAIDTTRYDAFPVYLDPEGCWWVGDALRKRETYPLNLSQLPDIKRVNLLLSSRHNDGKGRLSVQGGKKLFQKSKQIEFDIALPVFHGTYGEDGCFQGLMEIANIPYTGLRTTASGIVMNKDMAKKIFKDTGAPLLPSIAVEKPTDHFFDIDSFTTDLGLSYPVLVKPCNLGSSIGIHKANNQDDLNTALLDIFRIDTKAIIEPFIENLVEYNVAVSKAFGTLQLSAIEKPFRKGDIQDFHDKYLSAGGDGDSKLSVRLTEGMVSATRELNPKDLSDDHRALILDTASKVFETLEGTGAPRLDFYGNSETGELWLNEINPVPGSYGYFLWEASPGTDTPVTFTALITALIDEAKTIHQTQKQLRFDAGSAKAKLF
jgi:D-alanine-D-alanine ligase